MKILQVLPELNVGGVETGTLDLARQLIQRGHSCAVVSAGGELVRELVSCGARHYQVPVNHKSLPAMLQAYRRLREIIRAEKPDIVHARSRVPAWPAFFAARSENVAFVTTCHGYYRVHPFSFVMGWGKRVIVLSNAIARHMIDDFGVPQERIRLIPRSVDAQRFPYCDPTEKRTAEFNVGIIGRITPLKGHSFFIKAMALLAREIPGLKVWIIGDAPASKQAYKEQLKILVNRLGLQGVTQFLGVQRDIPGLLRHLDLLVLATTTQEAFGRVIIEAQSCGVPVVATEVGGVVDIIRDAQSGILVPPADPAAIATAAARVWRDPQLAVSLAQAGREIVERRFTLEEMVSRTLAVYEETLATRRILVIKLGSLGDIILAGASLQALRKKFPAGNNHISVLVRDEFQDVLLRSPYVDEVIVCGSKGEGGWRGLWRLGRRLSRKGFDICVDLQNNRDSHLLSWLSAAPQRFGYADRKWGFLLNRGIQDDRVPLEPVRHQFRVLKSLGIEYAGERLSLWPSPQDEEYVREFLGGQWLSGTQRLVGINLGASSRWQTKRWPVEQVARLCGLLAPRGIRMVLTGTAADAAPANALLSQLKEYAPINACGKTTVNQLACLIRRCVCFISGDSAPLHVAAAMGVPLVALFGPTDPKRHMPPSSRAVVLEQDIPCRRCYRPSCAHRRCMRQISAEEVREAVNRLLQPEEGMSRS